MTAAPCLPRCPWCRQPAKVWRDWQENPGGWIAGCSNSANCAGPKTGCVIQPHTLPMTTHAAAVREWKKLLPATRVRNL